MPRSKLKPRAGQTRLPRILKRTERRLSPWVRIVGKHVARHPGARREVFHCVRQPDAVAILARTASGLIPIVEQYRPAVEAVTWELPSGLRKRGELPAAACHRELWEETGLRARSVRCVGRYYPDTGRMEHQIHVFYAGTEDPNGAPRGEPGVGVRYVTPRQLRAAIRSGRFRYLHHIAALLLASWDGCAWDARAPRRRRKRHG